MRKISLATLTLLLLSACSKKESDKDLMLTGNIKGFKKGTIYIQKIKDTTLIPLDTIIIDGDSHFSSAMDIESPEMYYLFIDRGVTNSVDNNLPFFAEKGTINIETSLDRFTADAKITGSKNQELYDEYKSVTLRYVNRNLELIKKKFDAQIAKKPELIPAIEAQQNSVLRSKYLYTTNFAVNHSDYEVAPYLALAEIYDINLKYLDTIQKAMTPKVAKSLYGKKLTALLAERKKSEQ